MPARSAPAGRRWSWWSLATLETLRSGVPSAVAGGTPITPQPWTTSTEGRSSSLSSPDYVPHRHIVAR
jgi:hypothetical protein